MTLDKHTVLNAVRGAFAFLVAFSLMSQLFSQVKIYTVVSEKEIAFNQSFQVQYVIEGGKNIEEFKIPRFGDFRVEEVFDIPNTPSLHPKTLRLVNAYSRFVVLSPKKNGQLNIPGATAVVDGKFIRSNEVRVIVRKSGLSSLLEDEEDNDENVEDESELRSGENIEEKIKENFFLNATVNKTNCFVGESLMAIYKACSRLNASSQVVRRPSFSGFSVLEMVEGYDNHPDIEKINGKSFFVHILRKVQLFPLQPGTYELDAAEVQSVIHFLRVEEIDSEKPYELLNSRTDLPSHTAFDYNTLIKTNPVTITVKPLPDENQPDNFSGAVGQFSIHFMSSGKKLQPGELAKLKLVIIGKGNLQLITAPKIEWPKNFEVSETSVKEEVNKYVYPLTGSKIFEYSFSSQDTGNYSIPPVKFSFFDPEKKKYITAESSRFTFSVSGKQDKKKPTSINNTEVTSSPVVPLQWYYFAFIIIIILTWVLYQGVLLVKDKKGQAPKQTNVIEYTGKSQLDLVDRFSRARTALQNMDKKGFYQELQLALWKVASEKCNVLPSELNKKNVGYILSNCNIPADVVTRLTDILNECEWALYTPSTKEKNMSDLLENAEKTVHEILI